MKRVFIGVPLPEDIVKSLLVLQSGLPGVRLVGSENLHLTLRFIGVVDEPQLGVLDSLLSKLEFEEFLLQLEGVGVFPFRGSPKVIWAGLSLNPSLKKFQALIESKCRSAGLKPESRNYYPHITVGRVKCPRQNEISSWLERHRMFKSRNFFLDHFVIFQSILNSAGSIYNPIFDYKLAINHELHDFDRKEYL